MAFHIGGADAASDYFDPNRGAYRFADAASCAFAVACHMKEHYDDWKGGEYKLYQVSRS